MPIYGLFLIRFFPYKERMQGCFCKTLDYVFKRKKADHRKAYMFSHFYTVCLVTFKYLVDSGRRRRKDDFVLVADFKILLSDLIMTTAVH